MQRIIWRELIRDGIPGATVALIGMVLWFYTCRGTAQPQQAFIGWLFLLLVASTVAGVARTAAGPGVPRRRVAATAMLLVSVCLLIAIMGGGMGLIDLDAFFLLTVVCWTWTSLWILVARLFHARGPAVACTVALAPAMLFMASPIALMPLVHATHGSPIVVQFIRHACPFFALLDALRPAINFDWSHLPGMYAWSGLGQDVPMLLPNAWLCSTIYALAALLLCALHRLRVLCAEKAPQSRAKSPI